MNAPDLPLKIVGLVFAFWIALTAGNYLHWLGSNRRGPLRWTWTHFLTERTPKPYMALIVIGVASVLLVLIVRSTPDWFLWGIVIVYVDSCVDLVCSVVRRAINRSPNRPQP